MLSEPEQVKQNVDSVKEAAKLDKPITAHDKSGFKKPQPIARRNTIERFGKLVELDREIGQSVILMLGNVTRDDKRTRSEYDAGK